MRRLLHFLPPFLALLVNLALPSIGKDLNANAIQLGWVISSFILSSAIFLLPFGRFADIIGRKKVFSTGNSVVYNFHLSDYFLPQHHLSDNFKGVSGLSSAMIFGTSLAIITSVFEPGERGKAMGINITAVYLGLSMRACNRRIADTIFWMEKHFCLPGSVWYYLTYSYQTTNKNRMG